MDFVKFFFLLFLGTNLWEALVLSHKRSPLPLLPFQRISLSQFRGSRFLLSSLDFPQPFFGGKKTENEKHDETKEQQTTLPSILQVFFNLFFLTFPNLFGKQEWRVQRRVILNSTFPKLNLESVRMRTSPLTRSSLRGFFKLGL